MKNRYCDNCSVEDKKKKNYLCTEITAPDRLPLRCCHPGTFDKLSFLKYYLEIFGNAMKNQFQERIFMDLFSGPGLCGDRGSGKIMNGSSLTALGLPNPFTHYIFVDAMQETYSILKKRCDKVLECMRDRPNIESLNLDANKNIDLILEKISSRSAISVAFIDPNDLGIEFGTISKLAKSKYLDIIINFSIHDLKRNLETYSDDNYKADRFFGCRDWPKDELTWLPFYKERLKSLGFSAVESDLEPKVKMKTKTGADIYYLIYASKNELGLKFWRETKKKFLPRDIIPY